MRKIGVIGSGPAAFYTAQKLLKTCKHVSIDMFEKLPAPFGLVRYGVAPDHPEVKNVINTFKTVCENERFRYFGNVNIGSNLTMKDLRRVYDFVVLAYGASQDRKLDIPGEGLAGVYAATDLVGWYNGLPEKDEFIPDLSGEETAIIGHGNVALDIARILLTPIDLLKKTDIPEKVLEQLNESKIRRVSIIGRRGPLQVAFTIKEFRELVRCPQTMHRIHLPDGFQVDIETLPRPRKRLTNLMLESALDTSARNEGNGTVCREWDLVFQKKPVEIIGDKMSQKITGVQFENTKVENGSVINTGEKWCLNCQSVIRSIGYRSVQIDPDIPLDEAGRIVPNEKGRVTGLDGVYCVGWIKRGPVGVILDTIADAQETSGVIIQDMDRFEPRHATQDVTEILKDKGVRVVTLADWRNLDELEVTRGVVKGKPREKLTSMHDMLSEVARGRTSNNSQKITENGE